MEIKLNQFAQRVIEVSVFVISLLQKISWLWNSYGGVFVTETYDAAI